MLPMSGSEVVADEVRQAERREDEEADAEEQRDAHRAGDGPVRHLRLAFFALADDTLAE